MSTLIYSTKVVEESFNQLKRFLEKERGYELKSLKGVYDGDFAYSFWNGKKKFGQIFYHHAEDAMPGHETAAYVSFEPKTDLSKGCEYLTSSVFINPYEQTHVSRKEIQRYFRDFSAVRNAVKAICDYMEVENKAAAPK